MSLPLRPVVASLASLLAIVPAARAALVINTTFDHGSVDIAGNAASSAFLLGTGWESGSSNVKYESSSPATASWAGGDADYVLLPTGAVAGGLMLGQNAATLPAVRGMQVDLGAGGPLTGTFWLSALLRMGSATGTGSAVIAFENGTIASGASADRGGFGIRSDGAVVTTVGGATQPVATGATVADPTAWQLVLAKVTVNGSGAAGDANDSLSLWVFDATSTIAGQTEALLGTATFASTSMIFGTDVQDVWFGHYESVASGDALLDNLRVSNLGTDVGLQEVMTGVAIPEPSTVGLLAGLLGVGALALRRRRAAR